jgi:monoamine oxidase
LSQAKIPFRIFEAQTRVGGRILSLSEFNDSSQIAEMGAELIHAEDQRLLNLLQELRIAVDVQNMFPNIFLGSERVKPQVADNSFKKLQKLMQKMHLEAYGEANQFLTTKNRDLYPKAVQLDSISAKEFIHRVRKQLDEVQHEILQRWIQFRFAAPTDALSALALVETGMRGFSREWYKVPGGLSLLPQSLHDRIAGVVPGRFVRLQHQLRAIETSDQFYNLVFSSQGQEIEVRARNVICTLPVNVMTAIKGFDQLSFADSSKHLIAKTQQAQVTKLAVSQNEQFWRRTPQGQPLQWLETDLWSSSAPWQTSSLARPKNVMGFQFSGPRGQQGGPHLIDVAKNAIAVSEGKAMQFEGSWSMHNWGRIQTAKGAGSFLSSGFAEFRSDLVGIVNADTRFILAGEAYSVQAQGRVEGALNSAFDAAQFFIRKMKS